MLEPEQAAMLVIDFQDKLFRLMPDQELLAQRASQLVRGGAVFGLPMVWSEQYPQGIGSTIPPLACLQPGTKPFSKLAFSCCRDETLRKHIHDLGRKQFILCGIETHICVYQTAVDLLDMGYEVEVVADATASREPNNHRIGLERIRRAGAAITSMETVLFELLGTAESQSFKEILSIVK